MQKVLVTIKVPQIDKEYDVLLPINVSISDSIELLQKSVIELSSNEYSKKEKVLLMDEDSGLIFDGTISIKKSGIKNGSRLILY